MKAVTLFLGLIIYSLSSFSFAADGKMPGDNLDLNAVLELFKNSKNIEDFESKLNSEKSNINNLDLNEDGYVDYIRVIDYVKDNAHLITLQVAFTADEIQDVAVIELDRQDDKTVVQIVGDEALYGRDYIIEPKTENEKMAYNANTWTSVQYIYGPQYVVYVSPWYYGFYPHWHRPWRPYHWDVYYGYVHPYHMYYRPCGYYRSYHAHYHYYGHKSYSNTYYNSPKHIAAQQSLPVHKKSMTEANLKNTQGLKNTEIQKMDGNVKTNATQRELKKVDTNPSKTVETNRETPTRNTSSPNTRTTTPRTMNEPAIRTQPSTRNPQPTTRTPQTTRSPQPQRSTTSPTMRSPQQTSPSASPQRGTVNRQPATVQPSRSPAPATRRP